LPPVAERATRRLVDTSLNPGSEILLLEDEPLLRKRLSAALRAMGANVSETSKIEEARRLAKEMRFDYALVDLHLPDGNALTLLRDKVFSENTGVVVMTAFGGVPAAVEAMRLGAGDYLTKPFEPEELPIAFLRCRQTNAAARRVEYGLAAATARKDELFFGHGLASVRAKLDTILDTFRRLGKNLPPALIEGETGTGKTALARWLHTNGPRAAKPFISVNCAALPESLVESELFGHERGAFTDAKQARIGLFEAADGGVFFLDEIASLPAGTQAKILTVIEDGRIRRLGGAKETQVDVQLIVASNRPLQSMVETGAFREDLYHRLNLLTVALPPLRERGSDVVSLAKHLLQTIARRHQRPKLKISPAGETRLQSQAWRGNVRELAHEIERATIFSTGDLLDFAHLETSGHAPAQDWRNPAWRLPAEGFSLDGLIDAVITDALNETGGNISAAARRLGVTRDYLRYRLSPDRTP
jgi:DNA-binding NtrC family response regulator